MMTILELSCGDETHRIEILEDGTAVMLDHDEDLVRAFVEFGSAVPTCFAIQRRINGAEAAYRAATKTWTIDKTIGSAIGEAMKHVQDEMQRARRMTLRGRFADASSVGYTRHRKFVHHGAPTSILWRIYGGKLLTLEDVASSLDVRVVK